jgi:hypothetical protein
MSALFVFEVDPSSKESYELSARLIIFRLILKWEQARGLNPSNK